MRPDPFDIFVLKLLFVLATPFVVFAAGLWATVTFVPEVAPGLHLEDDEMRSAARSALFQADIGCREHVEHLISPRLQLVDIHLIAGPSRVSNAPAYEATIQKYTLFMVPTDAISVRNGSVLCAAGG